MTDLIAVPRYDRYCSVLIFNCGHNRLMREGAGYTALGVQLSCIRTTTCPGHAIDLIVVYL